MKDMPEIRFKGFTDVWVQRKLGEVAAITMGQSPDSTNYTDNPKDYILVQGNSDMKDGWVTPRVWTTQITKMATKGDLILSVRAPVGDIGKTEYDIVLGRGVCGIKGNEYLFQYLGKMKTNGYWTKISSGSTFDSINSNDLKDTLLSIPGNKEQTSIGNFFRILDNIITLYKRKADALKQLKKAYLQQMFPQEGETVPKVRFKGFEADWEEARLGDVASFKNGMNFSKEAMGHGFPFVNLQNIFGQSIVNTSSLELAESSEQQRNEYNLIKGDVLFIRSSVKLEGVGETAIIPCNLVNTTYSGFIIRCRMTEDFSDTFKQFIFSTKPFRSQILNNATTSANTNINQDSLSKITIKFPIMEEQNFIGNFFRNLDKQITVQQTKLDNIKQLKSAYLQKMFV